MIIIIYKYIFIELWKLYIFKCKLLSIYINAVGIVFMNIASYCSHMQIIATMISDIINFNIICTIIIIYINFSDNIYSYTCCTI